MTKNCPNCGAPIQSERCEFCGTLFGEGKCVVSVENCSFGISAQEAIENINRWMKVIGGQMK